MTTDISIARAGALGYVNALSHLPLQGPTTNLSPAHGVIFLGKLPQQPLYASDIIAHSA